MSRILKRPMFRKGGSPNKGIMTGLVDRKNYAEDGFVTPEGQRASELIPDIKNIISQFTPKTRLPIGRFGAKIALGQDPLEAFLAEYAGFTKEDDARKAAINKAAVNIGVTQAMKVPKKGFRILSKKELEENPQYSSLDPSKAYKINLDTNDVIQIGSGGTTINMGQLKTKTGATDKDKEKLGLQPEDDVVIEKDAAGNITDFKITSSVDQRMKNIGTAVEKSKLQEADDALRELENYIVELQRQGYKNLPGIGTVQGKVPGIAVSKEGLKLRALLAGYENITLKKRSGAAVTPSELLRVQNELAGAANTADESVFLEILRTNRKILEKQKKATFALYRDKDVKAYQDSGGLSLYGSPESQQTTEELKKQLEEDK
tara:strand:+ start:85 stop:1209 length:1125 start_codon:yes stop_codon:yes gene_type:complete